MAVLTSCPPAATRVFSAAWTEAVSGGDETLQKRWRTPRPSEGTSGVLEGPVTETV
jgi:hypothetical protein